MGSHILGLCEFGHVVISSESGILYFSEVMQADPSQIMSPSEENSWACDVYSMFLLHSEIGTLII